MEQVVTFLFKYRPAIFSKSQFGFGARPSTFIMIAALALVGLLVYFLYFRAHLKLTPGWRAALIGLRCLLLAFILVLLMRPVIVAPSVVPGSSYVAVLMDDSSSMLMADEGGQTRLDAVKRMMSPGAGFLSGLSEKFKLRPYRFASRADRVQDANELTGTGSRTDIAAALDQAVRDSAGLPLSGIVVLSDGAANSEGDIGESLSTALNNLRGRGLPVFTVGLGATELEGDVEVVRATAPRRALAGSPVTAEVLVRASDSSGRSVRIDLAEDNRPLRSQDVALQGQATTVARITFTPTTPGIHRYSFTAASAPEEPIKDNNFVEVVVEVEDARPKILYMEGEPRWEYGKMREALSDEKNLVLVSILRSADGKYYRQGVESAEDLAAGFPKSEEELFRYDAIIIGSVEATFFTFDQLRAIEQFVSRRGGTLLALGGSKSFSAGGYNNTPIADLLPVYLSTQNVAPGEPQTFKAAPSDRGRDHPAARLIEQADANQKAWDLMPAISLPEVITDTKPGATVILEARSIREKNRAVPLLVEERYGRGRTLALLANDTWRWRMMLESKNRSFETFWKNLLRYTVEQVRHAVEAAPDRSYYGRGEPARIRVEVADEKYLNVADAQLSARLISPSGEAIEVPMRQVLEGGFEGYEATVVPDEDGLYRFEVSARRGRDGAALGTARSSFVSGPLNREAYDAAQNRELLRRIAAETGGQYYAAADATNLIEDLTHTEGPSSIRVSYDLWDMPVNFLLVVGLAAGEWFIRKRKGLA
ncbi:MAG TPA: glutamine amidotransferase [Blastocatellia bacterium]|nr:glutamine amidotransferase [Blastocatellia bacterium]